MAPGMPDEAGPQLLKEKTEEDFSRVCDVHRVNISRIFLSISNANVVSTALDLSTYLFLPKGIPILSPKHVVINVTKALVAPSGVFLT